MKNLRICVYQICKNEINYIKKWYDSIKNEQDGIFVTDTGSIDGSLELLKSLPGVTVFEQKIIPWRFDTQRNISLQNIPQNYDIGLCLDLDETMEQGWRKEIEKNWNDNLNTIICYYISYQDENCTIEIKKTRERIHRIANAYWVYPIHEFVTFNKNNVENSSQFVGSIIFYHFPDKSKPRNYIDLILNYLKLDEFKNDPYLYYMLGMEYELINDFENIRQSTYIYLNLSQYTSDSHNFNIGSIRARSEAMNSIQRSILNENNNINEQLQWVLKQTSENLYSLNNWIIQQKVWMKIGNYSMVYACCKFQKFISDNYTTNQLATELNELLTYQQFKVKGEINGKS